MCVHQRQATSLVSIIIPAYNKAALTVKTVESALNQSYHNIEVIVVDDGSSDNTSEHLNRFKDKIKYIYKKNAGACSARNLGLRFAKGEFVGFLDCDDLYDPKKIEACIGYLEKYPKYGFVHTAVDFIDDKGNIVGHLSHPKSRYQGWSANRLILGNYICNSTVIIKRSCLDKSGYFDETIFTPADWDLWMRLAEVTPVGYIDEALTQYRVSDNYILDRLELAESEEKIVIEKFFTRNSQHNSLFKRRVLSNLYLRYAECYFLKNNISTLKEKYALSLRYNPLNLKGILLFFCFIFIRNPLRRELARRIIRTDR